MKKGTILLTILLFTFFAAACGEKTTGDAGRESLIRLMDQYLEALVKHDPSGVPLDSNVKLVENITPIPIGEGLWKTITGGPTEFKIYISDPVGGQIGFMGMIENEGNPRLLGARLKVVNGRITEIDHMVSSLALGGGTPEKLLKPREGLITKLTAAERVSREQMVKAANGYYEAIEFSDGTLGPFAEDCERRENGLPTALNEMSLPEGVEAGVAPGPMAIFHRMKCGPQLSTGIMGYITKMNQRRIFAVDEELGLVAVYSMMNHDGEPDPLKIANMPDITERANTWGQFTVPAMHIFKIKNGQIFEIEATAITGVPYRASDGWTCTRECLTDMMDNYLSALSKRNASTVPLADDVKIV